MLYYYLCARRCAPPPLRPALPCMSPARLLHRLRIPKGLNIRGNDTKGLQNDHFRTAARKWVHAVPKTRSFDKSDRPAAHTIEPCVWPAYQTNSCASTGRCRYPFRSTSVALLHEAHSSLDVCAGCGRVQWSCGAQP